jgi:D-amino-acid dehydrogenase
VVGSHNVKIAIIGAGVVGVATAFELVLDGHEVTVYERNNMAAEGASFAGGNLIVPGWIHPQVHAGTARRWLGQGEAQVAGLTLGSLPSANEWRWLLKWRRAARTVQQTAFASALQQLAQYSHDHLTDLSASQRLEYDSSNGVMVLWRSDRDALQAQATLDRMRALELPCQVLSPEQARALEPALNSDTRLHSALMLPAAQAANCRQVSLQLKALAQQGGCRFEFGVAVLGLQVGAGVTLNVAPTSPEHAGRPQTSDRFDAVVMCAGAASAGLMRTLGIQLPLMPLVGHSISAAIREPLDAPQSAVIDHRSQISISRLGQRVRVTGGAGLGMPHGLARAADLKPLYQALSDWFPGAARLGGNAGSVQEWRGVTACLPDGPPLVGESARPGVWMNLGHGHHGWAMALGSARALADQVRGRTPELDMAAFSPRRLGL